jgi:hypothetical protein
MSLLDKALDGDNSSEEEEDEDDMAFEDSICFYQNCEFKLWKQKQRKTNLKKTLKLTRANSPVDSTR